MNHIELAKPIGSLVSYDKKITELTDAEIAELKQLVLLRKAVFFKNQFLTTEEMKYVGARFSSSEIEPMYQEIDNTVNYNYGEAWHSDRAYTLNFPNYTIFQVDKMPDDPMTGDTMFINTVSLFRDCFSEQFKNMLRKLTVTNQDASIEKVTQTATGPVVSYTPRLRARHPMVLETLVGSNLEESIFANIAHTIKINELSGRESRAVVDHIFQVINGADEHKYRHRWSAGDLVIWSNRVCFHKGIRDFKMNDQRKSKRIMIW